MAVRTWKKEWKKGIRWKKHAGGWLVDFFLFNRKRQNKKGLIGLSSLSVDAWIAFIFSYH
jgi:hypothetical protein